MVRPDGSHTRQHDRTQGFFGPHDLTHFAVETILRFRRGFYGVVGDGWDLADFGHPWPKGPMPPETVVPEAIVGLFDQESATGNRWTADEYNASLADYLARAGIEAPVLTESQLVEIRSQKAALVRRWRTLAPGETMVLHFPL